MLIKKKVKYKYIQNSDEVSIYIFYINCYSKYEFL